jgi:hypothetical protein
MNSPAQKADALRELTQRPLAIMKCPSRPTTPLGQRSPGVFPYNARWIETVAKTDYAANEGDFITDTDGGPRTLELGLSTQYPWPFEASKATGLVYLRSTVKTGDVSDGLSKTIYVGEKNVSTKGYHSHADPGHDQDMYCGVDLDIARWTLEPPLRDTAENNERRFGSAHDDSSHFLMGDGSVHAITYSVDHQIFRAQGTRSGND